MIMLAPHAKCRREKNEDDQEGNSPDLSAQDLVVPVWCVSFTKTPAQAIVLAWLRYWLEPKGDATGPRTKCVIDGFRWGYGTYAQIAYATGLTADQSRSAIRSLIDDEFVIKCDPSAIIDAETEAVAVNRYRINARRVDDAMQAYAAQRAGLYGLTPAEAVDRMDEVSSKSEWGDHDEGTGETGWYRSRQQAYLASPESGELKKWTTITPRIVRAIGKPLDALVFCKVLNWQPLVAKSGKPLNRTLKQLADEIGLCSVSVRNSQTQRATTRLAEAGLVAKNMVRLRNGQAFNEFTIPAAALAKLKELGVTPKKPRARTTSDPTHTIGTIRNSRRPPCPQHAGPPDGRRRVLADPERTDSDGLWVYANQVWDADRRSYVDRTDTDAEYARLDGYGCSW